MDADFGNQIPLPLQVHDGLTFDTYVAGENAVVVAAIQAWANGELEQLYVYGSPGCGRTHLLSAALKVAEANNVPACLLPGKELVQMPVEILEGIEQYPLVAVDDVHCLAGEEWEEALFHLYNRCRDIGHHMLFSANAKPVDVGIQLADVVSRLNAGPVYKLHSLADQDLIELLQMRAKQRGLLINEDVAAYVIHRGVREPRALLKLLDTLDKSAMIQQRKITKPFIKSVLQW